MELSARIKAARKHLADTLGDKVSQTKLAKMCGDWSQNRISNYETSKRVASPADCATIANITGVRIEWLQLESGPMLANMIKENVSGYAMNPPIIEWNDIDSFLANPKDFDLIAKEVAPINVNDKRAFAVALPYISPDKYSQPRTAVIVPIEKDDDLTNKEVMCRDKKTGEKAFKIYTGAFGAISLIDPAEVLPPIVLEANDTIEIIGRVAIKYE